MLKMVGFDEFVNQCPYFYNSGTNINNGYNCAHPECGDSDTADTEYLKDCKIGRCHTFTCPLCVEADGESFNETEIDKNGFTEYEEGEIVLVEIKEDKAVI